MLQSRRKFNIRWMPTLLLLLGQPLYAQYSCHIHPPVEKEQTSVPKPEGPLSNQEVCGEENLKRYGGRGRCHCSFTLSASDTGTYAPGGAQGKPSPLP
jgi:hypothetical protein